MIISFSIYFCTYFFISAFEMGAIPAFFRFMAQVKAWNIEEMQILLILKSIESSTIFNLPRVILRQPSPTTPEAWPVRADIVTALSILLVLIALCSRPGYIWTIWLRAIALAFVRGF
jgi:hypothetical protein